MDCNVVISDYSLRLAVVYIPPSTQKNGLKTFILTFHQIGILLSSNSVLQSCGMLQHMKEPTHFLEHTLDVVIARETD